MMRKNFWKDKNVLLTGIDGFVGSHLGTALVARGADVTGVIWNNLSKDKNIIFLRLLDKINIEKGSVSSYNFLQKIFKKYNIDTCFHLAAQAIVGRAYKSPLETFSSNIQGTWNILEACRTSRKLARVVIASSDKVYGNRENRSLPFSEDAALRATFPYDASKACADMLSRAFFCTYELPVAICRSANIFGGGDMNFSRIVPGTIRSIIFNEAPIIRSDGTPVRDYIYISDIVNAYLSLGGHLHCPEVMGEPFNFSLGEPVSALALVNKLVELSGKTYLKPLVKGKKKKIMEIDEQYLSSCKAQRTLGWRAEVSMDEGLRKTIEWYREYFRCKKEKR